MCLPFPSVTYVDRGSDQPGQTCQIQAQTLKRKKDSPGERWYLLYITYAKANAGHSCGKYEPNLWSRLIAKVFFRSEGKCCVPSIRHCVRAPGPVFSHRQRGWPPMLHPFLHLLSVSGRQSRLWYQSQLCWKPVTVSHVTSDKLINPFWSLVSSSIERGMVMKYFKCCWEDSMWLYEALQKYPAI